MIVYVLLITLPNLTIQCPYKFAFRDTCVKLGKEIASTKKEWRYSCVSKNIRKPTG